MSHAAVRPFRREDREQVTALINSHVGAVVPGWAVPVQTVMAQIERDPGEFVVDPWVTERGTLVAVERDRVVAAAHLCRYSTETDVGDGFRGAGEIKWFVCWPAALDAGRALIDASNALLARWRSSRVHAGVQLPTPVTYGVSDCWPHLRQLLVEAGFSPAGKLEIVMSVGTDELADHLSPPVAGLRVRREVAESATRFVAETADAGAIAWVHVQPDLTAGGLINRLAGWGSVWELGVAERWRRRGVGTWLLSKTAEQLRVGGVQRLLDQAWPEQTDLLAFHAAVGFQELTRIETGWIRPG